MSIGVSAQRDFSDIFGACMNLFTLLRQKKTKRKFDFLAWAEMDELVREIRNHLCDETDRRNEILCQRHCRYVGYLTGYCRISWTGPHRDCTCFGSPISKSRFPISQLRSKPLKKIARVILNITQI